MKKIFTLVSTFVCSSLFAQTSGFENCSNAAGFFHSLFKGNPTLISGTNLLKGSIYRYDNAVSSPSSVYALVKIDSIQNAALVQLDVADSFDAAADERLQPLIKPDLQVLNSNRSGFVQFTISFYNTANNSPALFSSSVFKQSDIDGFATGSNGWFRETGGVRNAVGFALSVNPETELVDLGTATDLTGIWERFNGSTAEHGNFSTDDEASVNVSFIAGNSITFRLGYDFKYGHTNFQSPASRDYAVSINCISMIEFGPLPVKISSFDAFPVGKAAQLKWITEQEIDFDHFEIERSFSGNDFKTVGFVMGPRSVQGAKSNYEYMDNDSRLQVKPVAFYRLKEIDKNGKVSYSQVRAVYFRQIASTTLMASPNPFINVIDLSFSSEVGGVGGVRIIDISGHTIMAKKINVATGKNIVKLTELGQVSKGMYIAEILVNNSIVGHQKLIKD